jgi:hypothetical protein
MGATVEIPAGDGLADALSHAAPGDTLVLGPGVHRGGVVISPTSRIRMVGDG